MKVTFTGPNIAKQIAPTEETGTFTMVYDQGFQFWLNGNEYFANFNFSQSGSKVSSYCYETLTGWYNTDEQASKKWGCFRGVKVAEADGSRTRMHLMSNEHQLPQRSQSQELYRSPKGFVKRINTEQNLWTAKEYPELWDKMTVSEAQAKLGIPLSKVRVEGHQRHMQLMRQYQKQQESEGLLVRSDRKLPKNFSWRDYHNQTFVPDVRSQGSCGSCYAFGSTGSAMGRVRVQTQNAKQTHFSPQDLMSCYNGAKSEGIFSQRCEGGFPFLMGKRARQVGFNTEECFPYEAKDGKCSDARCHKPTFVKEYGYLGGYYGASTEQLMMENIYDFGPLAVNVQATQGWFHYSHGIYREPSFDTSSVDPKFEATNHIVVIVAWGEDETTGTKFWELQNSWGSSWGEQGYMRIVRGEDMCTIEHQTVHYNMDV
eukprot:CAMPEP_0117442986 /NCGR_PEP_ID=MMETSP0759-20121206/4449_1 /TAXON_ID=63605 /ORGANISM="Percolomonas cosmopolitus, Strain WS" /LENGTH=427 /DNA_ID=CAMNT_0005234921 /DNA_START=237 /DNA_END=1520 /DNA_ORIENTATION=+